VIATRVGGVADVVSPRTDGELVESGNDEAFCAAMLKVARGRQRISQARSKEVRNRYSIQRLVRDIEGIYEELLEGSEAVSGGTATQMAWADRGK
jgi:glycosyltransferase involved in cell wall biosynthesis